MKSQHNCGYIYVLTSPSGKHYVGQSWNIKSRWNCYLKLQGKGQPKLYNALKHYGPENFIFYIIDAANTQENLDKKEAYWISSYDSINNGYNNREGGRGCTLNPRLEEISVKIDDDEKIQMETNAKKLGFKNLSAYIRAMCIHGFMICGIDPKYLPKKS